MHFCLTSRLPVCSGAASQGLGASGFLRILSKATQDHTVLFTVLLTQSVGLP